MSRSHSHIMGRCVSLLVLLVLLSLPVHAAGPEKNAGTAFWETMSVRLQRVVPEKEIAGSINDEGEAIQPDQSKVLYWKGKEPDKVVPRAELAAFNMALQSVVDGKHDEAVKGFEDFLAQYPQSVLADDARTALSLLGADKTKKSP